MSRKARVMQNRCRVTGRISEAKDSSPSPQAFINFGGKLCIAVAGLQHQQGIDGHHFSQSLTVRQRRAKLDEVLRTDPMGGSTRQELTQAAQPKQPESLLRRIRFPTPQLCGQSRDTAPVTSERHPAWWTRRNARCALLWPRSPQSAARSRN